MAPEPIITVNGRELTGAQAATVRIAIQGFLIDLADSDFADLLGKIAPLYRARAREVEDLMLRRQ